MQRWHNQRQQEKRQREHDLVHLVFNLFHPLFVDGGAFDAEGAEGYDFFGPESRFAPHLSELSPSLDAISQFVQIGPNALSGAVPIETGLPNWAFNVLVIGALVDSTFGTLNQRLWAGSVTLAATHRLDSRTAIGIAGNLGQAHGTASTALATLSTGTLGADLVVARLLSPSLIGSLYLGYDLDRHHLTVANVASDFLSHGFKAGTTVQGKIAFQTLTVTPSISALLEYRHQPAYTDSAGVAFPALDTLTLQGTAGVTVSRDFVSAETGTVFSPFVGANIVVDRRVTSPGTTGTIPVEALWGEVTAGLEVLWSEGASSRLAASLAGSGHSMALSASGSVTVPIN